MNEALNRIEGEAPQQLTNRGGTAGVPQEYFSFTGWRRVALTDARLVSIAEQWNALPQTLRNRLVRLCLQASTKNA